MQPLQRSPNGNFIKFSKSAKETLSNREKGKIKHFFLKQNEIKFESKTKLEYTYKNEYNFFTKQNELRLGPEVVLKTEHVKKKEIIGIFIIIV